MNLAIDIGNSFTHIAAFSAKKCIIQASFNNSISGGYHRTLKRIFEIISGSNASIGISSVVPGLTPKCVKEAKKAFSIKPLIINNKTKLPLKIKINNPGLIGADRLCNAVAGYEYFGRKHNVIIVDMGTANTYDVVLKSGEFIGGIIAPGIMTSAKALNTLTGKLPLLNFNEIKFNRSIVGKNTMQALQSGLLNYPLYATNGIISTIECELDRKFKVILTGGSSKAFLKRLSHPATYIENTVLNGINIILNHQPVK